MKFTPKQITTIGLTAALYVVLTLALYPISYGLIQFRISEIMTLLAFLDPIYIPGLVIGCIISNFLGPFGMLDVITGSLATFLSAYMMSKCKNLFIASLWPTINCIFVAAQLHFTANFPFWQSTMYIAFGEFVVVTLIGYPIFRLLLSENYIKKSNSL